MKRRWKILGGVAAIGVVATVALNVHLPLPVVTIAPSGQLLLTGVTVVNTADGSAVANMDVLTDKGRIVSVTASGTTHPAGAQIVDAHGKFVVPGYNDLHAHPLDNGDDPSGALALMLANGITGFRQMSGSPEMLQQRKESTLPLGRYAPAALIMPGTILTPFNAGSPQEAVATVDEQKREGADFIKVGLASPEIFFAAENEAKRVGLPFAGHLQAGVDAAEASRHGMRAIEHLGPGDTVLVGCSTDEAVLRAAIAKRPIMKAPLVKLPFMERIFAGTILKRIVNPAADADIADTSRFARIAATFSDDKCRAQAAVFVANNTWHAPTLVRLRTIELGEAPEYAGDPHLRYMPAAVVESWRDATARFAKNQSAVAKADFRTAFTMQLRLTKVLDDAGVKMLAGSDESGQWEVPGFSLHQEFDLLASAGLSPLKILQMTTLNGAEFLGRTGTMGSVAAGRDADLVLLDANPVESVANLHRISGVVRAGYYYSRHDLDGILAKVEAGKGYFK